MHGRGSRGRISCHPSILIVLLATTATAVEHTLQGEQSFDSAGAPNVGSLYLYDLRYAYALSSQAGFEEVQLVAALAGLVNRAVPSLYLLVEATDSAWLQRSPWTASATLTNISGGVEGLLAALLPRGNPVRGVVLYDPALPCTSSLALTAAGAEDLLPIAYRPADNNSLYARLVNGGPRLRVGRSLVGIFNGTASPKRAAYEWAAATYLDSGASNPFELNYYVDAWAASHLPGRYDAATLPNLDFGVARRGFFFDLAVWDDEAPIDEPSQPLGSDLAALRTVLSSAALAARGELIHLRGFTPWAYKYVSPNGRHGGVETEWATVRVTSAYNVIVDADACCIGNVRRAVVRVNMGLGNVPSA